MKNNYVIKNIPTKLPVSGTVLYSFLMWHFEAPSWLWGVFISFFAIGWILAIINIVAEDRIDLFKKNDNAEKEAVRISFKERLENLQKQQKS